jgi:hypothetical protein
MQKIKFCKYGSRLFGKFASPLCELLFGPFPSSGANGGVRTLNLRFRIRVFDHCATGAQPNYVKDLVFICECLDCWCLRKGFKCFQA